MTFEKACYIIAMKHGLGMTLVTGHKASYFKEAANLCISSNKDQSQEEREALGNLLAVMHGDGGHYQEKHGTVKAIKDAQQLIYTKYTVKDI